MPATKLGKSLLLLFRALPDLVKPSHRFSAFPNWEMGAARVILAFPNWEMAVATVILAFPNWEIAVARVILAFPNWEMADARVILAFPNWEMTDARVILAFPGWEKAVARFFGFSRLGKSTQQFSAFPDWEKARNGFSAFPSWEKVAARFSALCICTPMPKSVQGLLLLRLEIRFRQHGYSFGQRAFQALRHQSQLSWLQTIDRPLPSICR